MAIYTFKTQPIPLLYLLARTPDAIEEWVKWFFSPPKKRLFNNNYSPDNFLYFDLVPSKDKCHTESISDLIKIEEKCEIHVDLGGSLCDVAPLYIPLEEGLTLIVHIEHMAIFSEEVVKGYRENKEYFHHGNLYGFFGKFPTCYLMSEDIFDKIRDKDYTPYCEEARRQMESYRPEQVQLETVKHQAHDAFSFVGPEGKNDREGIAYKTSSGFMKVENVPPCETNVCGPLSKKGSQN